MSEPEITIYTDGACDIHAQNQPGGWAAILVARSTNGAVLKESVVTGGAENTTNNRMEMQAVIEGLLAIQTPSPITVVTDSKYVMNTITRNWKRKKNHDLWEQLDALCDEHEVRWKYVKGHAGHEYNERCDRLAVAEKKKRAKTTAAPVDQSQMPDTLINIYLKAHAGKGKKPGGWGAICLEDGQPTKMCGALDASCASDNHAALLAMVSLLEMLSLTEATTIYTDIEYLQKGMMEWLPGWMKRNWKTASKQPVKYAELWQRLHDLAQEQTIYWRFLKDKTDNPYYKQANKLAHIAQQEADM